MSVAAWHTHPGTLVEAEVRHPAILTILAAATNKAREAQADSSPRVTAGTMFARRADLLTAKPPTALGTI